VGKGSAEGGDLFQGCNNIVRLCCPFICEIGPCAFSRCKGLLSVDLPRCSSLGEKSFSSCYSLRSVNVPSSLFISQSTFSRCHRLRHVKFHSQATVSPATFYCCSSLEVIASSQRFKIDNGKTYGSQNDPTNGITQYLHSINSRDAMRRGLNFTLVRCLTLCTLPLQNDETLCRAYPVTNTKVRLDQRTSKPRN